MKVRQPVERTGDGQTGEEEDLTKDGERDGQEEGEQPLRQAGVVAEAVCGEEPCRGEGEGEQAEPQELEGDLGQGGIVAGWEGVSGRRRDQRGGE